MMAVEFDMVVDGLYIWKLVYCLQLDDVWQQLLQI